MGKPVTLTANTALMAASARGYWGWCRATGRMSEAQEAVLRRIVRRNANTCFGREHRFPDIRSVADYQRLVPLRSYDDFAPYIQRIASGESNVLTAEPVILFEPTSGSTTASKLVPYTRSLQQEFQRGISPWLYSTYRTWPGLLTGKQYWSITPVGASKSYTDGGIPIGFEEDSQYFGSVGQRVVGRLMAVPAAVRAIQDLETFRYLTLRFLLQCRDLSLVSVWNPTFLALLLEALPRHSDALLSDLSKGSLTPPGPKSPQPPFAKGGQRGIPGLQQDIRRDPGRAKRIDKLLEASGGDTAWRDNWGRSVYEAIWPRLQLISCWADGPAREYATGLQHLFPNIQVQPKGLLATEGFVSFPLSRRVGAALAINSHFYEFIDAGAGAAGGVEEARPAYQLEPGKVYSVAITTGGGLYRYRLHDLVEVTGFIGQCPLLRFLGKEDAVVDLFGEKLHEDHVRQVVKHQLALHGMVPDFWIVAPERNGEHSAHYTLFVQCCCPEATSAQETGMQKLAVDLDIGLQENFHYKYCRQLGQLHPLRVFLIESDLGDAGALFLETCHSLGQRLGDVKPAGLHSFPGWGGIFPGRYVSR